MDHAKQPLLNALRLNAAFSAISAICLFLAGGWVAAQLGLASAVPVYLVAGGLVLFALQLILIVRTGRIRHWEVRAIIGGDIAWVIGSAVLVALFYESITTIGLVMVDGVAIAVAVFAFLQIRGLRYFQQLA